MDRLYRLYVLLSCPALLSNVGGGSESLDMVKRDFSMIAQQEINKGAIDDRSRVEINGDVEVPRSDDAAYLEEAEKGV